MALKDFVRELFLCLALIIFALLLFLFSLLYVTFVTWPILKLRELYGWEDPGTATTEWLWYWEDTFDLFAFHPFQMAGVSYAM